MKDAPPFTYAAFVQSRLKAGMDIYEQFGPVKANLAHLAMGVSGEAGELLDAVKKHVIYNKPLDRDNIIEELGDLEFFLEGLRQALGLRREDILNANIAKLSKRYEKGYSDAEASARADKNPSA